VTYDLGSGTLEPADNLARLAAGERDADEQLAALLDREPEKLVRILGVV
jgi:hypothetical protein